MDDDINTSGLEAVIERPELWQVSINENPVTAENGKFRIDRDFGVYQIGKYVIRGKNRIRLAASSMTIHTELEPVYLFGDFSLAAADKGWKLVRESNIGLGSWNLQGLPFYSDGVTYTKKYTLADTESRYVLYLPEWSGTIAGISVNGKYAGIIGWAPYELNITDFVSKGENQISVTVFGSLKNLLGPHHNNPPHGAAWPSQFESAPELQPPGINYDVIKYGLFDDFEIIEIDGKEQKYYNKYYRVSNPVIISNETLIKDEPVTVKISSGTSNADIYYTVDGMIPTEESNLYIEPLLLKKTTLLRTIAVKDGLISSPVVSRNFYKINCKNVKYRNKYSVKYTGGGDNALIDCVRGSTDFTDSRWQGFEQEDFDVIIELIKPVNVRQISIGFLQNIGSWIYFPKSVEFGISGDGKT